MSNLDIKSGDRVRWKPYGEKHGLVGHEGVVAAISENLGNLTWCWVEWDDGTELDMYLSELELIK
jgi:plastocyanin